MSVKGGINLRIITVHLTNEQGHDSSLWRWERQNWDIL